MDIEPNVNSQALQAPAPQMSPVPPLQIQRDEPDVDPQRAALVERYSADVKRSRTIFSKTFKQMHRDQNFLRGRQWTSDPENEEKYIANVTQRIIAQRTSALYAKDPTATCRRRQILDFKIWDGERSSLLPLQAILNPQAQPMLDQNGQPIMDPMTHQPAMLPPPPPDPQAIALLADVQQGLAKRFMMDRIAKSMEIVFKHQMEAQSPPFKKSMKQLVRRVLTNSVGYAKIGYQRFLERRPEDSERISDLTTRIAQIARIEADINDGKIKMDDADAERLRLDLEALQEAPQDHISREGLVFDFPKSSHIIVDPICTNLSGFVGARWVAQEYYLDPDDIKEIWKKDIKDNSTPYYTNDQGQYVTSQTGTPNDKKMPSRILVWEIYSKKDGLVYWIADGYKDFLEEPAPPKVRLKRFWPWFPLVFNEAENEKDIYPLSDVSLMRPMQLEYNRARNGLREHRFANRPATAVAFGALDPKDEEKLANFPANALIKLKVLNQGQKIGDVLQPIVRPPIDPAVYATADIWDDFQRVTGSQEANLGGTTSGVSATQSGIAESSRMSSMASNVDDLEDMLSELFGAAGEILFSQMSAETVTEIAGIGSVWPVLKPQDIANELYLTVEAGSSGRPNKAIDIANAEKLIPLIMQIPGVSPEFILKLLIQRLDDKLDPTDAVADAVQSIVSMNRGAQAPGQGANVAGGDPHMQGPQGAAPPGAMAAPPGGPTPHPGPGAGHPRSPGMHSTLSGPNPGSPPPNRMVNPAQV